MASKVSGEVLREGIAGARARRCCTGWAAGSVGVGAGPPHVPRMPPPLNSPWACRRWLVELIGQRQDRLASQSVQRQRQRQKAAGAANPAGPPPPRLSLSLPQACWRAPSPSPASLWRLWSCRSA